MYEFLVPSIATGATYKLLPLYQKGHSVDTLTVLPYSFLLSHYATRAWNALDVGQVVRAVGPWYMEKLKSNPMATKSITAGFVGAAGDLMAQWFSAMFLCSTASPRYHVRRGMAVFLDGLVSGPLMHLGYDVFERVLPTRSQCADSLAEECEMDERQPSSQSELSASLAAIVHVLADSVILDSFFVGTTILFTGILEGVPSAKLLAQFRTDYWATLRASWVTSTLLFPIQFSCFRYLPLRVRVLAVNCVDVIWDGVLSYYAHRSRTRTPRMVLS